MNMIHKTAIIGSDVIIGDNVRIGPYAVIDGKVKISNNNNIMSSVYMTGNTEIGENNLFHPFCSIGSPPQDLKFNNEITKLEIGKNNIFREYSTVNLGTVGGGGVTKIADNSLFMIGAHVAHDCLVGNNVIMANQATIAGHVIVDDNAILGGLSAVHQFVRIGSFSMIGGMSAVEYDVVPFGLVTGNRAHLMGINIIGLRRAKYSNEIIREFKAAFDSIFNSNEIKTESLKFNENSNVLIAELVRFIQSDSMRGMCSFK
tara:strand:+ start:553 stop:1329 length:777 start_codon:yes stop_codon:yes gene_type:complete